MIVATTQPPYGSKIIGIVVASIPVFGNTYGEGLKNLEGKTNPDIPAQLESRRTEVLRRLVAHARKRGATAVYGVMFDQREINSTWKELCAYGTAVVEP